MRILFLATLLGLAFGIAQAQPDTMHFQGQFLDGSGQPLADGTYSATFILCRSGCTVEVWSETKNVTLTDGVLSTELGSSTSLNSLPFDVEYHLKTTLNGTTYPAQMLTSSPYAFYAHTTEDLILPMDLFGTEGMNLFRVSRQGTEYGRAINGNTRHGIGVYGYVSNGVPALETSSDSIGVMGLNAHHSGKGIGVYGESWSSDGYAGYFEGGQGVVLAGDGGTHDNGIIRSDPGEVSSDLVFYANDDFAIHLDDNDDETGQFTIVDGADVGIFAVREDGIITTDLILDGAGDNGNIRSNPTDGDSDLVLYTNDLISIHLDDNADQSNSYFSIVNGGNDEVFRVEENGTVKVEGTTVHTSDRNRKEAFRLVDTQQVLERVAEMPMMEWAYKGQSVRHLGPMAQDFFAAFGLGEGETTISAVNADGVALAAIQALYRENRDLRRRLERLEAVLGEHETGH